MLVQNNDYILYIYNILYFIQSKHQLSFQFQSGRVESLDYSLQSTNPVPVPGFTLGSLFAAQLFLEGAGARASSLYALVHPVCIQADKTAQ